MKINYKNRTKKKFLPPILYRHLVTSNHECHHLFHLHAPTLYQIILLKSRNQVSLQILIFEHIEDKYRIPL